MSHVACRNVACWRKTALGFGRVRMSGSGYGWKRQWEQENEHRVVESGVAVQVAIFDQFSPTFHPLIQTYQTPNAICGFTTLAVSSVLASDMGFGTPDFPLPPTQEGIQLLLDGLMSESEFVPKVEPYMEGIATARSAYVAAHDGDFGSQKEKERYAKDWVANYEISDVLGREQRGVVFVRNVEREDDCTHEELARLVDEARFQDVTLFFDTDGQTYLPSEFLAAHDPMSKVYIVDTLGHFVVAIPLSYVCDDGDVVPLLLVLNTSSGSYIQRSQIALLHAVIFGRQSELTHPPLVYP